MSGNGLLVCVSGSRTSADLVRRGAELARILDVEWTAVHVQSRLSDASIPRDAGAALENLELAEQLGAKTEVLAGNDVAGTVVEYALRERISRILIGKRAGRGFRQALRRGVAARLVERSGDMDVYVVQGSAARAPVRSIAVSSARRWLRLSISVGTIAAATALGHLFPRGDVGTANVVMVYLAAVFSASVLFGWRYGLIASVLAVLSFNFFFTIPFYTFVVSDPQYLIAFAVMLGVSLVASALAARVRSLAEMSRTRERRTHALYELSRSLARASGEVQVRRMASGELSALLGFRASLFTGVEIDGIADESVRLLATRCIASGRPVSVDAGSPERMVVLPLPGHAGPLGVMVLEADHAASGEVAADQALLAGAASLVAFALERERADAAARDRLVEVENERTRNGLLRGISHDLRTPIASIVGSSTTILRGALDDDTTRSLVAAIADEAGWMGRVVENMLNVTRFESGGLKPNITPETVDDLVTSSVSLACGNARNGADDEGARVDVRLPEELVVVPMDLGLMQQALMNVLDNALRYSPPDSRITLSVVLRDREVDLVIEDEGPGIAPEDLSRIFQKFFRGTGPAHVRGSGLGLWIAAEVVHAHHGTIDAANRSECGARIRISLPREKSNGNKAVAPHR